jgi:hypothetical protein
MITLSCYHDNMLSYFFPWKPHTLIEIELFNTMLFEGECNFQRVVNDIPAWVLSSHMRSIQVWHHGTPDVIWCDDWIFCSVEQLLNTADVHHTDQNKILVIYFAVQISVVKPHHNVCDFNPLTFSVVKNTNILEAPRKIEAAFSRF